LYGRVLTFAIEDTTSGSRARVRNCTTGAARLSVTTAYIAVVDVRALKGERSDHIKSGGRGMSLVVEDTEVVTFSLGQT